MQAAKGVLLERSDARVIGEGGSSDRVPHVGPYGSSNHAERGSCACDRCGRPPTEARSALSPSTHPLDAWRGSGAFNPLRFFCVTPHTWVPTVRRTMRNEGLVHVTAAVDLLWRHAVPSLPPPILWMLGGGQGLLTRPGFFVSPHLKTSAQTREA